MNFSLVHIRIFIAFVFFCYFRFIRFPRNTSAAKTFVDFLILYRLLILLEFIGFECENLNLNLLLNSFTSFSLSFFVTKRKLQSSVECNWNTEKEFVGCWRENEFRFTNCFEIFLIKIKFHVFSLTFYDFWVFGTWRNVNKDRKFRRFHW